MDPHGDRERRDDVDAELEQLASGGRSAADGDRAASTGGELDLPPVGNPLGPPGAADGTTLGPFEDALRAARGAAHAARCSDITAVDGETRDGSEIADEETVEFDSTRFGRVRVPRSIVVSFPQGMIGFPHHTEYALLKQREDSVFMWLHSVTDPELAFPVVLPWAFYWAYEVRVGDEDLESIGVENPSQISILCVVNVGSDVRRGTINLFSPIVINNETRLARQVINTADGYSTRDPLFHGAAQPTPVAMHEVESRNVAVLQRAA